MGAVQRSGPFYLLSGSWGKAAETRARTARETIGAANFILALPVKRAQEQKDSEHSATGA
jgi:hypothetical protein